MIMTRKCPAHNNRDMDLESQKLQQEEDQHTERRHNWARVTSQFLGSMFAYASPCPSYLFVWFADLDNT